MLEILILFLFPGAMACAAASDLVTMTISNWVSVALIVGFGLLAAWTGMGLGLIGIHVLVGVVALVAGFICFAFGWIGGGDAKLFAATALWLGWGGIAQYAILAAFLGGALTIALVMLRQVPLPEALTQHVWIKRLHTLKDGVPYGLALAAAGLWVYPNSIWMNGALG